MRIVPLGDDAPLQHWCLVAHELNYSGIKRHQRDRSGIACEHVNCALRQSRVVIKAAFEFQQQRRPPRDKITQFSQCKDASSASLETNRLDLSGAQLCERATAFG